MWNTRVKCKHVWSRLDTHRFETGKIYNVINGKLIFPNGSESNGTYDCIDKLNKCFYAIFEEVDK